MRELLFLFGIFLVFAVKKCISKFRRDLVMEMWKKDEDSCPPEVKSKCKWYHDMRDMNSREEQLKLTKSLQIYIDREWKKRGFFGINAQLSAQKNKERS